MSMATETNVNKLKFISMKRTETNFNIQDAKTFFARNLECGSLGKKIPAKIFQLIISLRKMLLDALKTFPVQFFFEKFYKLFYDFGNVFGLG
jgi:hypothetical protein